jgi:hypothetical protein
MGAISNMTVMAIQTLFEPVQNVWGEVNCGYIFE